MKLAFGRMPSPERVFLAVNHLSVGQIAFPFGACPLNFSR